MNRERFKAERMTTLPWIGGMAISAALQYVADPPRPRLSRWQAGQDVIAAVVIGLGLMELWRSHIRTPLINGPGSLLPHTSVAAFVLGYFCVSVASRMLEAWRKR